MIKYPSRGILNLSKEEVTTLDLTTEEAAKQLSEREGKSVLRDTVKHWCQQGRFPNARRVGTGRRGYWLIPQSDLDSFELPPIGRPKE